MLLSNRFFQLIFICYFLFSCSNGSNEKYYDEKTNMSKVLELTKSFEHDKGIGIRLWCDKQYIYISNDPDFKIYIYNYLGKLIRTLGKKGPAPFENNALWYFNIEESGKSYWVHDRAKQLLKKFDLTKDTLITTRKISTMENVLYIGENKFIIPHSEDNKNSFSLSIYDINTSAYIQNIDLLSFPNLENLKKEKYLAYVFEGNFCKNKDYAVYYCYSTGIFFIINLRKKSATPMWDVRNLPIPKVHIKNGEIQLEPKLFTSTSAAMDNKYLYSLTTKDVTDIRGKGKFQIDVYDIEANEYKGSFEIDKLNGVDKPREIAVDSNKMVILFESGTINTYKIDTSSLSTLKK